MQLAIKMKQRCLLCTKKIKKDEIVLIKKNGTVVHEICIRKKLSSNA